MPPQLPILAGGIPGMVCIFTGIAAAAFILSGLLRGHKLDRIPTVGSSGWLGSWWASLKYMWNAHNLIREGYRKYKPIPFKIADSYGHWFVFVSSRQHIEELQKAPNDVLSFLAEINHSMKFGYTLGPEIIHTPYHTEVLRGQLTRNLSNMHSIMRDEISAAFDELLDLQDNEWKCVPAWSTVQKVVCRVNNRIFVGLPLCRDPDWMDINLRFTFDVVGAAHKIRLFPTFLAPIIVRFMTGVPYCKKRAMKHLAPVIEERLQLLEEYGSDWPDRPNDFLSWLLEEAPEGVERTVERLTTRVMTINFAANHTSSSSFAHALFFLAENPQYVQPLREEVETIVKAEGWSKASLAKMHKIDSFMKESQRMIGIGAFSLGRMAIKDFTFSDGTFIPKGTTVAAPQAPLHLDDEYYENAHVFDPFRFSDMREKDEESKHYFVSTSPEYLPFGHGKYACPGRFFAGNELKSMLAHIAVTYDIKLEDNKPRPEVTHIWAAFLPDPFAKVMFRRRVD